MTPYASKMSASIETLKSRPTVNLTDELSCTQVDQHADWEGMAGLPSSDDLDGLRRCSRLRGAKIPPRRVAVLRVRSPSNFADCQDEQRALSIVDECLLTRSTAPLDGYAIAWQVKHAGAGVVR